MSSPKDESVYTVNASKFDSKPESYLSIMPNIEHEDKMDTNNTTKTESATCPINHASSSSSNVNEPPDTKRDHTISHFHNMAKVIKKENSTDIHDVIPGMEIPSTGRGNSESGKEWLNPSANQLYHALKRKNKPIQKDDALSVAAIHAIVTEQTWQNIMKYEKYHENECKNPRLARFEGKDGIYSPKAKFCHYIMGLPYPYDRHDWTIDRCGKEVQYIIDYYAIPIASPSPSLSKEEENKSNEDKRYAPFIQDENVEFMYTIDARPKMNSFSNIVDRVKLAYTNWKNGQQWF